MNLNLLLILIGIGVVVIIYAISKYVKYIHSSDREDIFNRRLYTRIYRNKMHMAGHSDKEIHKNLRKMEEKSKHEQGDKNKRNDKIGKAALVAEEFL